MPDDILIAKNEVIKVALVEGSDEGVGAYLQGIAMAIEAAAFTNNADRGAVAQMLFNLEWTLQVAIEEVLAQRRGSAALMQTRRTGRQLWGQLRSTHRVKGLLRRVRDARGGGELLGGEASRGWAEGSVSAWLRRVSGRAAGTGPADTELQSPRYMSRGGREIMCASELRRCGGEGGGGEGSDGLCSACYGYGYG